MDIAVASPGAGRARRRAVFTIVVVAVLMHALDQTAVATALPTMQADLGTTPARIGWTITIYGLGQIVVLPLAGTLGDRFGVRRVLLAGVGCFVAASVACGLSPGVGVLVAARLVQGMAGAVLLPSATALVTREFGAARDRAVASFTTIIPIGAILGPVVGGVIVTLADWRGIFVVNVPIGVVLLVAGAVTIRRAPRGTAGRIDPVGIALLTALLLAVMVAITAVATVGAWAVLAAAVAVGAAALLWRHVHRHPAPVVPPDLLVGGHLGVLNLTNLLFGAAALGFSALIPQYAEIRYGVPPLAAAGMLTVRSVLLIAASMCAVALLRRWGHTPILVAGVIVNVVALVLTALPPLVPPPQLWLTVASGVLGAGLGLTAPAASNAGLSMVPDRAAALSGLQVMFRQLGAILAVSAVTTVASSAADPGTATAVAVGVLAAVMGVALLFVFRIPNHRGPW